MTRSSHPYETYPPRQFWSKAVSRNFCPDDVVTVQSPLLKKTDQIASAGSCFAANIIPYLKKVGFDYLKTEYTHFIFDDIPPENMAYGTFSAGYGNIYTTRQLYQLLLRCLKQFSPQEDRWITNKGVIDPFRPGLKYHALSEKEHELMLGSHLKATLEAFSTCTVFIFTLGLTEAWVSTLDGAVFPVCPGTINGVFDPTRHAFVNFTLDEVYHDLKNFILLLRETNPEVKIILTVSPVPLVATATPRHVLSATTYSKSVLRVAAEQACLEFDYVHYFPAYEIATGPQAPFEFFEKDRRTVTKEAIDTIMAAFLAHCETDQLSPSEDTHQQKPEAVNLVSVSQNIADAECEEAALDHFFVS